MRDGGRQAAERRRLHGQRDAAHGQRRHRGGSERRRREEREPFGFLPVAASRFLALHVRRKPLLLVDDRPRAAGRRFQPLGDLRRLIVAVVVRVIARHLLQADEIRLHLRDRVDRALQVVFVRSVDAVLDVERHHGDGARVVGACAGLRREHRRACDEDE